MDIIGGSVKFRFGISRPEQFNEWLESNSNVSAIAMIGRSNVGKSSIINSIFGKKTARTSKTPGRTREINIFTFKVGNINDEDSMSEHVLFDLPGYGHAEVSKQMKKNWQILMGLFFEKAPRQTLMVNIQDARHPMQKADLEFQTYLKSLNYEAFLLFNKMDKLKTQKERSILNKKKKEIFKEYKFVKQIFFASAEKKTGVPEVKQSFISFLLKGIEEKGIDED